MHGCMDAWMHGCMDAWMHGCMDAWMHGCMYACMHVCMHACMDVCLSVCLSVCLCVCVLIQVPNISEVHLLPLCIILPSVGISFHKLSRAVQQQQQPGIPELDPRISHTTIISLDDTNMSRHLDLPAAL